MSRTKIRGRELAKDPLIQTRVNLGVQHMDYLNRMSETFEKSVSFCVRACIDAMIEMHKEHGKEIADLFMGTVPDRLRSVEASIGDVLKKEDAQEKRIQEIEQRLKQVGA